MINNIFGERSNLNFSNMKNLIKSLEEKPSKDWLRRISECEDEKVLKYLINNQNEIKIKDEEGIEIVMGLLPDADFVKKSYGKTFGNREKSFYFLS